MEIRLQDGEHRVSYTGSDDGATWVNGDDVGERPCTLRHGDVFTLGWRERVREVGRARRHSFRYEGHAEEPRALGRSSSPPPPTGPRPPCKRPRTAAAADGRTRRPCEAADEAAGGSGERARAAPRGIPAPDLEALGELARCAVCHEDFKDPRILPGCGHTFCCDCIRKWLARAPSCPLCRHPAPATAELAKNLFCAQVVDHCRLARPENQGEPTRTARWSARKGGLVPGAACKTCRGPFLRREFLLVREVYGGEGSLSSQDKFHWNEDCLGDQFDAVKNCALEAVEPETPQNWLEAEGLLSRLRPTP